MSLFTYAAGHAIMKRKVNPKVSFSCRIHPQPNFLVLGGTGPRAAGIREQVFLQCAEHCHTSRWPMLVLSGDASVTDALLRRNRENVIVLGQDCSYDPIASSADSMEASRILESILPIFSQQYGNTGTGNFSGAMAFARFLMDVIIESFGTDALTLITLDQAVRSIERQADVLSSLHWMQENGYRVSESLQSSLTQAWNNGSVSTLSNLMAAMRRSLRFLTNEQQESAGISELMDEGYIPVAEIPRAYGDRDAAVSVICAELMNYIDSSGQFALLNYEVPLPASARDMINSAVFCTAMTSLRMMNAPHLQIEDLLPVSDTVLCLGMPDMAQAQQLTQFYASRQYTYMPDFGGKGGMHMAPVQVESFSPHHLLSGSFKRREVEDGGGVVFDEYETVNFYRNIWIR